MDRTEQVDFWRGEFGQAYIERNAADQFHLKNALVFWSKIIYLCRRNGHVPASILEIGPNIGINLRALSHITEAEMSGIEPIAEAVERLVADGVLAKDRAYEGVGMDIPLGDGEVDFSFTNGVLIHIHPDQLEQTCREIHRVSNRYVFCSEYFSVSEQEIGYRGYANKLFKRDFGSYYLDLFPDLRLIDYGFEWKRVTGLDNMTWWLFEKPQA